MLFFIRHQGTEYKVRVESRFGETYIAFNDEPESVVDLRYFGHDCTFVDGNEVFHANVVGDKNDYTVWCAGGNLSFSVESEYRRIVSMLRGQAVEQSDNVYAKMPGKIVKISVKPGDEVEKGACVIVMEAMKMENEIRALTSGVVKNILVKEGQAVDSGALLLELEASS